MPTQEWNLELCLMKCSPSLPTKTQIFLDKIRPREINIEHLGNAYQTIAQIVSKYGDNYLPIFERIHYEIEHYKSKQALLQIALNIDDSNLSTGKIRTKNTNSLSHIFSHVSHTNYLT